MPLSPRVRAVVQGPDASGPPIVLVSVEGGESEETEDGERRPPPAAGAADANAARHLLRRAGASACAALSLGVLGSTVFPVPFAVSRTGLLSAALTMLLVAAANDATSGWLIDASLATGHSSYESLALWAGGRRMRRLTQLSLIALLWGTMVAGLCLIADTGRMALLHCFGGGVAPAPAGGGRLVMLAVSALVLFPLCLQRRMRELEAAGAAGGVLVLGLVALLIWRAGKAAWRGLADVPIWSLAPGDPALLPEAFAIYFTAFYMQPMLLPLVRDMPGVEEEEDEEGGRRESAPQRPTAAQGLSALRWAVRITLYLVACGVYLGVGIAGAGAFGAETHGNILTNDVLDEGWGAKDGAGAGGGGIGGNGSNYGGRRRPSPSPPSPSSAPHPKRRAAAVLYALVLLYLALGMTTTQFALRSSLDIALFGAAGDDVGADAPVRPPVEVGIDADEEEEEEEEEEEDKEHDPEQQQQQQQDAVRQDQQRQRRTGSSNSGGGGGGGNKPARPPSSSSDATAAAPSLPPPPLLHPHHLRPGFTWPRHVLLTAGSIASAAAVACLVPRAAEKVYAVVGATGVCAVSYVIPAVLKVQLYRAKKGLVARVGEDGEVGGGGGGRGSGEQHTRVVAAARRAPRPPVAASSSALSLPLLGGVVNGGGGDQQEDDAYIFGAAAVALPSALLPPPPAPSPAPTAARGGAVAVAVRGGRRQPPDAAAAAAHHHRLRRRRRRCFWRLLPSFADVPPGPERRALLREVALEVGLPIAVAAFGVLSSAAALAVAVRSAFFSGGRGGHGGGAKVDGGFAWLLGRAVEAYVL